MLRKICEMNTFLNISLVPFSSTQFMEIKINNNNNDNNIYNHNDNDNYNNKVNYITSFGRRKQV
jgi:hypothetical protein